MVVLHTTVDLIIVVGLVLFWLSFYVLSLLMVFMMLLILYLFSGCFPLIFQLEFPLSNFWFEDRLG